MNVLRITGPIKISVLFGLTLCNFTVGQSTMCDKPSLISETDIYFDNQTNVRYSNLITFKFAENIIELSIGDTLAKIEDISDFELKTSFSRWQKKYGDFKIIKLIPYSTWGDTLKINKRTGRLIKVDDRSQIFQVQFQNLVPIDSLIYELNKFRKILYVDGPLQMFCNYEPNDSLFLYDNNWAFDKIQAELGWEITKGCSSVIIAINDLHGGVKELHEDLFGKVVWHENRFGNHGTCVAGVAGACTNNYVGVASLGWNIRLMLNNCMKVESIYNAVDNGADVINFSWSGIINFGSIKEAIKYAISLGVVCVASASNDESVTPYTAYPAAHNFGELGQVIAVSATQWAWNKETFVDGWNYSPGSDPLKDTLRSFVDVAAPGKDISILSNTSNKEYLSGCGTSLATPFVSALVGLLFSVDSTLTPIEVYNIITSTADKVGQYPYNKNGWNQYLGYGRINAYKALDAVRQLTYKNEITKSGDLTCYNLEQNYPNPFNPATKIQYSLPVVAMSSDEVINVTLKIYDILGREVAMLVNEKQRPGYYEVEFNSFSGPVRNLSTGIYFYQLTAGNYIETKKMILLR